MDKDRINRSNPISAFSTFALTRSPRSQRAEFIKQLKSAINSLVNQRRSFAVLLIKIDNLTDIEQNFGMELSQHLIVSIGQQLQPQLCRDDLLVHLHGDEFALLKVSIASSAAAIQLAKQIQARFRCSFVVKDYRLICSCSIGISLQRQPQRISQILQQADRALKTASTQGTGHYVLAQQSPQQTLHRDLIQQQERLALAIANNDIHPYYQPIIELSSNQLIGFEVIPYWQDEYANSNQLQPLTSLAEHTDSLVNLDLHIVRQACLQLKAWHNAALANQQLQLAVSLSVKHLQLEGAVEQLILLIQESQIPTHCLIFEFREHDVMASSKFVMQSLQKLRQVGLQVGLDDFATEFSSLSAFFTYPIDFVKIDQSFTAQMLRSKKDLALIRVIRDISHDMGFKVIVEGINSQQQHNKLIELGCEYGQGEYIARPLSPSQAAGLLGI